MILFYARKRYAICSSDDKLTTGSVGIEVAFHFSDDWAAAPARIAVFRGSGQTVDVALLEDSCTVPPEVLTQPGSTLTIGVYGTDGAGTVVIPTIYAEAGQIKRGAEPSGVEPTPQTQPLIDQLLAAAQAARNAADEAERLAKSVKDAADAGEFDGKPGAPGPAGAPGAAGNGIWRTNVDPQSFTIWGVTTNYYDFADLSGTPSRQVQVGDLVLKKGDTIYWVADVATDARVVEIGSIKGTSGDPGPQGVPGLGFPAGGKSLHVLRKKTDTDYDTEWANPMDLLSDEVKQAILEFAEKAAYAYPTGMAIYTRLYNAFYPPNTVVLLTAVFDQGSTVIYDDTALNDLKQYLTVTAKYDDNTTAILADSAYSLSGLLEAPSSTVTVLYNGVSTTFTAAVTARPTLNSISAVYTQSGEVYTTDSLDSLKADLVVTAHYSDSSTETVAAEDYTLSGELTEGTSTITVSYGGKAATFNVTVTNGTEILITNTYGTSSTGGTWVSSTPPFRATTSGTAGWSLTITPNTTGLPSPKISDMIGHKCRLVVTSDWASSVEGSTLNVAIIGTSSNNGAQSRGAYKLYTIKPDSPNLDIEFVVSQAYFTSDSSKYNANHYFTWRVYVYSNAGADVTFDVHLYDLGLEA